MNKNVVVALVVILGLILVGGGVAYFLGGLGGGSADSDRGGFFDSLFPFMSDSILGGGTGPGAETPIAEEGPVPELRLVSPGPVAGAVFTSEGNIRFVERETGHLFETPANSLTVVRISNTTIPGIQEVVWLDDNRFVLRYLDNDRLESYSGHLASSTPDQTVSGTFLPEAGRMLAHDGDILALALSSAGSHLDRMDADGAAPQTIFSSPIRSWVPSLGGDNIFMTSAPTALAPGYMYALEDGSLTKVFGGQSGLMTLPSPDGHFVAYSASAADRGTFGVFDRESRTNIPLPAETLAPKCVWLPGAETSALFCGVPAETADHILPDDWLLGYTEFADRAWIVYPGSRTAEIVADVSDEARIPIDIVSPVASPDGQYIIFINKNDLSLWSLRLGKSQ